MHGECVKFDRNADHESVGTDRAENKFLDFVVRFGRGSVTLNLHHPNKTLAHGGDARDL